MVDGLVSVQFFAWSVVWSVVSALVGGQCFAFSWVGGRFLFSRMICGHSALISIWSVVSALRLSVHGWSVISGFTLGLQLEPSHEKLHTWTNSKIWNKNDSLVLHESI